MRLGGNVRERGALPFCSTTEAPPSSARGSPSGQRFVVNFNGLSFIEEKLVRAAKYLFFALGCTLFVLYAFQAFTQLGCG